MDPLEKLYNHYNVLFDAKEEIAKFESHYLEIIEAVKGSSTEKRLASQFICKFFKDFPTLHDIALNALFDLCEDAEVEIRKQVIKDLPSVCKDHEDNVSKITDILCQLLITDDLTELQIIHLSLISLCKISPKLFLTGLFTQIETAEDITKERAIHFLHNKIKTLPSDFWSKENEEFFLQESKKILVDASKEEFKILMTILSNLKFCKRISGQQILLDIVNQNIHLERDIDPENEEQMENFLFYLKHAITCFSHYVCSNEYVQFICQKIITKHQYFTEDEQVKENFNILPVLNGLGEISAFIQPTNTNIPINLIECEKIIYEKLLSYLLEPKEDGSAIEFKFDYLESLLFTFHNFGKKNSENIIEEIGGAEALKDLKKRLQHLGLSCQEKIKILQTSTRQINEAIQSPKTIALKRIQNLQAIIKDMFYLKPIFKASLTPSWKLNSNVSSPNKIVLQTPVSSETDNSNGFKKEENNEVAAETNSNKRKLITAPEKDPEEEKKVKKVYTPPSGKYSNKNNFRSFNGKKKPRNGSSTRGNSRFKKNDRRW